MDSLSFKDKICSFLPNFLLFDQTSLLYCKSDCNYPVYSDVHVGQAPCEPPGSVGFRNSSTAEYQAWASSVRKKIVSASQHLRLKCIITQRIHIDYFLSYRLFPCLICCTRGISKSNRTRRFARRLPNVNIAIYGIIAIRFAGEETN